MLLTNPAATTTGARRLELSHALCKLLVELTFVWAADTLRLALVEKLLQEGRVLHCLGQKRHHLLLALLCGLQTAHQPLCLLLGVLEREQKTDAWKQGTGAAMYNTTAQERNNVVDRTSATNVMHAT